MVREPGSVSVWDDLREVLLELREAHPCPLQGYPDPRADQDHQPPFDIRLLPWALETAARLYDRFGDAVQLTVGALRYPDPVAGKPWPTREVSVVDPERLGVRLLAPVTVHSGHTERGAIVVTNKSEDVLAIRTNGTLVALVVDPVTHEVVGGFSGSIPLPLVTFRAARGEEVEIPLLVGTASFVPALGYSVPPGQWDMVADLDLGEGQRVRSPTVALTIV